MIQIHRCKSVSPFLHTQITGGKAINDRQRVTHHSMAVCNRRLSVRSHDSGCQRLSQADHSLSVHATRLLGEQESTLKPECTEFQAGQVLTGFGRGLAFDSDRPTENFHPHPA